MSDEEIVFRIIDRESNMACGVYSRAYHDEYDFNSADSARNANCHGIHKDKEDYKINKYRLIYELIEEDVDATSEDIEEARALKVKNRKIVEQFYKDNPEWKRRGEV